MTRRGIARTLVHLSLIAATLVVLLPLVVVLLTSLKSEKEMANTSGALELPHDLLNFNNYVAAFRDGEMLSAFTNTTIILLVSVTGTVLIAAGSLVVASAQSYPQVLIGRGISGLGGALVLPTSLALITTTFFSIDDC